MACSVAIWDWNVPIYGIQNYFKKIWAGPRDPERTLCIFVLGHDDKPIYIYHAVVNWQQ